MQYKCHENYWNIFIGLLQFNQYCSIDTIKRYEKVDDMTMRFREFSALLLGIAMIEVVKLNTDFYKTEQKFIGCS